jgi:hypothetical protein
MHTAAIVDDIQLAERVHAKLAGLCRRCAELRVWSRKSLAVASPVALLIVNWIDQMRLLTKSPKK